MSKSAADVCRERGWKFGERITPVSFGSVPESRIYKILDFQDDWVLLERSDGSRTTFTINDPIAYWNKLDDTPPHYVGLIQPWDAIEAWGLGFHAGNVVKYLARAGKKGPAIDDYRKALDYLKRLIELEEAK